MLGLNILFIAIAICLLIFVISYVLTNYILPAIDKTKKIKEANEWFKNAEKQVIKMYEKIGYLDNTLSRAINNYEDLNTRETAAIELSDAIVKFLVKPSLKEK